MHVCFGSLAVGQFAPVCLDTCCTPKADIVQVCGMRPLQPRVAWHSRVANLDKTVAIVFSYSDRVVTGVTAFSLDSVMNLLRLGSKERVNHELLALNLDRRRAGIAGSDLAFAWHHSRCDPADERDRLGHLW